MSIPRSVAEVIKKHVTLEAEGIDRMYLNVYQPKLQTERPAAFFRFHRGQPVASSALMGVMSKAFLREVDGFVEQHRIPLSPSARDNARTTLPRNTGRAFKEAKGRRSSARPKKKSPSFAPRNERDPNGKKYPWIVKTTPVNQFYFYCIDEDFGPFFLKFCTYFPYNAKLCINGHEYVKRQLAKEGIAFEPLDNGILRCADPNACSRFATACRRPRSTRCCASGWRKLPHPYTAADRKAGYRYDVSILQAEFSLTQVLDRPQTGRIFFEEIIRENLDLGRPDQVQLIFERRVTKRTPGRFRTARLDRRRDAVAARGLQEQQDQAIPQGRPGPAHRDHHQQHLRLRHRQGAA